MKPALLFRSLLLAFQIASAQSGTYMDRHDFGADGQTGRDGHSPSSGVSFDKNGNIIGTSFEGGQNSRGMVWEITSAGVFKDLHDFGANVINANGGFGADGTSPSSSVSFDESGNLYGTTSYGGPNGVYPGDRIVWEIATAGYYKDLHDFGGTTTNANGTVGPDGTLPNAGVTFDEAGNMYGTAQRSGAITLIYNGGGGIVWEITAAGAYKDLHDFGGRVINANERLGFDGRDPTVAGSTSRTASLTIDAPSLKSLSLSPAYVKGRKSSLAKITLTLAAPAGGLTISLSSTSSRASVPGSVRIHAGATSATFSVKTKSVTTTNNATISASLNGAPTSASLTITA